MDFWGRSNPSRGLFVALTVTFFALVASIHPAYGQGFCRLLFAELPVHYSIFQGIPVDQKMVAELTEYPLNWTYKKLGGFDQTDPVPLKGYSSDVYLATKPSGEKVVLKHYIFESSAARDFASYQLLAKALEGQEGVFRVPHVQHSSINRAILEIEYVEGIDVTSFMRMNAHKHITPGAKVIRDQYNQAVLKVAEVLRDEFKLKPHRGPYGLLEVSFHGPKGELIAIHASNILLVRSPKTITGYEFVLVDPE